MKYKIVKQGDSSVTSTNATELKRRIASSRSEFRKFTIGTYSFQDKTGNICFEVKYSFRNPGDADKINVSDALPVKGSAAKGVVSKPGKRYIPRIIGVQSNIKK
jgi:hypothetical protein